MNVARYLQDEWAWIIGLLALGALVVLLTWRFRRLERNGSWGPGIDRSADSTGYLPADLRDVGTIVDIPSEQDRWLLGLAAPHVEQAGMLHDRWSLVPAFCSQEWRRCLFVHAQVWRVASAADWRGEVERLEYEIAAAEPRGDRADQRPWLLSRLAMVMRLGVAGRYVTGARARTRLAAVAEPLREVCGDWLKYGDAVMTVETRVHPRRAAETRADMRALYAPGGPWASG